jgi:hypothetical protein
MLDQQRHYFMLIYAYKHRSCMFSALLSRCLQRADTRCKRLKRVISFHMMHGINSLKLSELIKNFPVFMVKQTFVSVIARSRKWSCPEPVESSLDTNFYFLFYMFSHVYPGMPNLLIFEDPGINIIFSP